MNNTDNFKHTTDIRLAGYCYYRNTELARIEKPHKGNKFKFYFTADELSWEQLKQDFVRSPELKFMQSLDALISLTR